MSGIKLKECPFCGEELEVADKRTKGHFHCYKLKDGETINVSAG